MTPKKKYQDLTDLEKIEKQWHKLSGLHNRQEWSASIVRAATAAEIAANFAIRAEFTSQSELTKDFVNRVLIWSNGLAGKMDRLLIPLTLHNSARNKIMNSLKKIAIRISDKRNAVAHQGEFCNEDEARKVIAEAEQFITILIQVYEPDFELKKRKK